MKIVFYFLLFLLFFSFIPEKDLIRFKRFIDSFGFFEVFKKGFLSFVNFFNQLTGFDFLKFTSNIFYSLQFYLKKFQFFK